MIVDHRTYSVIPGKLAELLKIYEELGLPPQRKYLGEPIGWYVSMDIGELNQVVHMWRYEDLADRAARRAKLAADPGWQAYLKQGMPLLQKMENKILSPAPFFKP
ncbi:MAG: NIPSNAP family protein [Pseudomonadota bacterium]|nr:NIPSNAP family protein [Pseudomonadota bacterium]